MEFEFDVNLLFPDTITRTVGGQLPSAFRHQRSNGVRERVATVVNVMGLASAKAQGLRAPITSYQKLSCSNQILYIMKEGNSNNGKGVIVGILKTGQKNLFLNDPCGVQHEVSPLCVLDFYVHESKQRCGYGKALFEAMLKAENLSPFEVAIDRPSPKFLGFLRKHYKLQSYVRQANNYVVFDQFFTTCTDVSQKPRRGLLQKNDEAKHPLLGGDIGNPGCKSNQEKTISQNQPFQPSSLENNGRVDFKESLINDTISPNRNTNKSVKDGDVCLPSGTTTVVSKPTTSLNQSTIGNGSLDDVMMMSPSMDIIKQHSQPLTRRNRFDIITGRPLQLDPRAAHETKTQTSFTNSSLPTTTASRDASSNKADSASTNLLLGNNNADVHVHHQQQVQKAPYLNMRQAGRQRLQNNTSFAGISSSLSTYRASFQARPAAASGFYSSSCSNVLGSSTTAAAKYSKHAMQLVQGSRTSKSAPQGSTFILPAAAGSDNPMLGTKKIDWSTPGSNNNMSASNLKDKWKTFIL